MWLKLHLTDDQRPDFSGDILRWTHERAGFAQSALMWLILSSWCFAPLLSCSPGSVYRMKHFLMAFPFTMRNIWWWVYLDVQNCQQHSDFNTVSLLGWDWQLPHSLEQWFSIFLMLWPFNTVPHVVANHNHKFFSLLLHNCSFSSLLNRNVNA